jgi:hypothetical protein
LVNQEAVGDEGSAIGKRRGGRYRDPREVYSRRWKPYFDAHRRMILTATIAVVGLLIASFLIVSSKGQGMNPILPVGLGFFVAYIAVRRKDD